ncbi:hypothetical protein [Flectobacillus major]|uniref:hypothetical protein n=1 Tax=Flectobacillus major TaxID=103 RepID=UPI000425C788|nr:hypothetical protein [Flectobacillus major]
MPKYATFPLLIDSSVFLSITKLKKTGYLEPFSCKSGVITWYRKEQPIMSASFMVDTVEFPSYIKVSFDYNNEPRTYKITLKPRESNLGKGEYYYFICPYSGKQCRKLYIQDGKILHRTCLKGAMYNLQVRSKKERFIDTKFGAYFEREHILSQSRQKYLKRHYKGEITKRYAKILECFEQASLITEYEYEQLVIML